MTWGQVFVTMYGFEAMGRQSSPIFVFLYVYTKRLKYLLQAAYITAECFR